MTAAPTEDPAAGPVDSLEMRWIFHGQLPPAMLEWFARFPAGTETRQDAYLVQPRLRGLSVKLRDGGALDVKSYLGSPRILGLPRAAVAAWSPGASGRFPVACRAMAAPTRRAGSSSASPGAAASSRWPAARIWRRSRRQLPWRGAWWNSPRYGCAVNGGGRWGSKRPGQCACCAAPLSTPPIWYSPRRCRPGCNSAWATPSPTRTGWASGRPSCRGRDPRCEAAHHVGSL
jgi:hypothetical protein